MGKQPATGQRKTKDAIAKAASQKKGGRKKWTKGKVKQKSNNAVFFDQANYDRIVNDIPKMGRLVSVSTLVQKFKIGGSIARVLLKRLSANGTLKAAQHHSKQGLFSSTIVLKKGNVQQGEKKAQGTKKGGKKTTAQKK